MLDLFPPLQRSFTTACFSPEIPKRGNNATVFKWKILTRVNRKSLMRQACVNLIGMHFQASAGPQDGNANMSGLVCSSKKERTEGGWEDPLAKRRPFLLFICMLLIFWSQSQCCLNFTGWLFSAENVLGVLRRALACSNPEEPDLAEFHPLSEATGPHHPPLNPASAHLPLHAIQLRPLAGGRWGLRAVGGRAETCAAQPSQAPRCCFPLSR